jgi:hypothetical protein
MGWQLPLIVTVQITELGKLLGIPPTDFGLRIFFYRIPKRDRVSCDPKSLTVKGSLMVVKVLSVMESARRRGLSKVHQPNLTRRKEVVSYAEEDGKCGNSQSGRALSIEYWQRYSSSTEEAG